MPICISSPEHDIPAKNGASRSYIGHGHPRRTLASPTRDFTLEAVGRLLRDDLRRDVAVEVFPAATTRSRAAIAADKRDRRAIACFPFHPLLLVPLPASILQTFTTPLRSPLTTQLENGVSTVPRAQMAS